MTPLYVTLFTPMKAKVTIVWLCLVTQDDGRSQVDGTAHERAPSHNGASMWLCLLMNGKLLELRSGGATRGKGIMPDEKGREWNVFNV
jgi:hypothetical protein